MLSVNTPPPLIPFPSRHPGQPQPFISARLEVCGRNSPSSTTNQLRQYFGPGRSTAPSKVPLLHFLPPSSLRDQTGEDASCVSRFDRRFHLYSAFWGTEDSFGSSLIFPLHFIPSHSESHQARPIIGSPPIEKRMHGGRICREYVRGFKLWQPSTEHENTRLCGKEMEK